MQITPGPSCGTARSKLASWDVPAASSSIAPSPPKLAARLHFGRMCGVCQTVCTDKEEACTDWAAKGECEKNPQSMMCACSSALYTPAPAPPPMRGVRAPSVLGSTLQDALSRAHFMALRRGCQAHLSPAVLTSRPV